MNIVTLRDESIKVLAGLKKGNINPVKAREMNNTSSKIMQSVSLEMKREAQTGRKRVIDFIDNGITYNKVTVKAKKTVKPTSKKRNKK